MWAAVDMNRAIQMDVGKCEYVKVGFMMIFELILRNPGHEMRV
jgi:hypothetical protein